jgi:protein-S-isoprenylcysteine O-methyltransferase Ste14
VPWPPLARLETERPADALDELWRLLRRRPARWPGWRDLWKACLAGLGVLALAFAVSRAPVLSPLGVAIVTVAALVTYWLGIFLAQSAVPGGDRRQGGRGPPGP